MKSFFETRILPVFLAAFLVAIPAWAAGAQAFLQGKQAELTKIVQQPKSAESDKALQTKFDSLLDYDALSKDSLADHWASLSGEQKEEFKNLLRTLVQRAYTKNIRETLDYEVTFKGESDAQGGKLVKTVASHKTDKRKEPIQIDYLLHQVGGQWRVFDIVTEGSSLVSNYKSQFKRVIDKKGIDGLFERMRSKAATE